MDPNHFDTPHSAASSSAPLPSTTSTSWTPPFYLPEGSLSSLSLPSVRVSKYSRSTFHQSNDSPFPPETAAPACFPFPTASLSPAPSPHEVPKRIPRPPNAFMLYRSHLLKNKAIPPSAEKRQQHLSQVAGQCWNMMPPQDKQIWHDLAAEQLKEHQLKYPDYKFTPAARGSSRKAKGKDAEHSAIADKDRIRQLREEYTNICGPAPAPARRRKGKKTEHTLSRDELDPETIPLFDVPGLSTTASPSSSSLPSSPSSSLRDDSLPPVFPNPSYPHYGDDLTHMFDFNSALMNEYPFPRPPSASSINASIPSSPSSDGGLSMRMNDLSVTPTAASFQECGAHTSPPEHLRQPPSFTNLNKDMTSSEPPFMSPLIPSPSDLGEAAPVQNFLEGAPPAPYFTTMGYVNEPYEPTNFNLDEMGSFPDLALTDDYLNMAMWDFTGDGGVGASLM